MRKLLDMIRLFERAMPKYLYHGTSDEAWDNIRDTDEMMAMDDTHTDGREFPKAISFSASEKVAKSFAEQAAKNDGTEEGVVIVFDSAKLAALFPLERYHDDNMSGSWAHFMDEEEYRIVQSPIKGIRAAVVNTRVVWLDNHDFEPSHLRSTSSIIQDAVDEVHADYEGRYQGGCEGAAHELANILRDNYTIVEGRYMKVMDWGDGTTHPFTPHWWVEVGDYILDPTRDQFGSSNWIVNKRHSEAKVYQYGGVGQQ